MAIGGSAGGFEALQRLLEGMPPDSGLTFMAVLHADPHAKSYAAELLRKSTEMTVSEAVDGEAARPNHVYLAPPGKELALERGLLVTRSIEGSRGHSIDSFLRLVAKEQGDHLICVILSGTGSDGSLGIRAVKEHGGISFAQSIESAKFDGMPRSAIATGMVDYVLPVEEIPQRLIECAAIARARLAGHEGGGLIEVEQSLEGILGVLRQHARHDFTSYKTNMILRRIERRVLLRGLQTAEEYLELLRNEPGEVDALFRDLLIGVTQFLRDAGAFESLASQAIEPLLDGEVTDRPLRIWCPGCATGEEAYSVAIVVAELQALRGTMRPVQIFATDLDESSLETARAGLYQPSIEADVSRQRLERFFRREEGGYRVSKRIREVVIFPRHNLVSDPPFSKLDLITCRNVLIYLTMELQKRLLGLFHYALNNGGYLFLGPSESITGAEELFDVVDQNARLFVSKAALHPPLIEFPRFPRPASDFGEPRAYVQEDRVREIAGRFAKNSLLESYAPPAVTVDRHHRVVEFHGRTGRYLEPASGAPDIDVVKMARGVLRSRLSAALREASRTRRVVVSRGAKLAGGDGVPEVDLVVRPLPEDEITAGCFLIVFDEPGGREEISEEFAVLDTAGDPLATELEEELARTRERLRATVESLEGSNEELRCLERRDAVDERGAAVGQRRARDLEGRTAVGQRRAQHGQHRAALAAR